MPARHNPYKEGESWKTGSGLKQERMEAYLEWMLTPSSLREPLSKTKFAESLDITYQTLLNYEREKWFQSELDRRARGLFKAARLQDVIDNMYEIATSESHKNAVSAARLLLEWSGKKSADEKDSSVEELSLEDLLERVNAFIDREQESNVGD